jgi:hypothetical protein
MHTVYIQYIGMVRGKTLHIYVYSVIVHAMHPFRDNVIIYIDANSFETLFKLVFWGKKSFGIATIIIIIRYVRVLLLIHNIML